MRGKRAYGGTINMVRLSRKLLRRHFLFSMIPPFFLDCVVALSDNQ